MTDPGTTVAEQDEVQSPAPVQEEKPQFFKVRLSHPDLNRKTVFRTVSESRARKFLTNRFPRGEEAYLEHPDGTTESYQAERTGEHGKDTDLWSSFNPDEYQPMEVGVPPGDSAWADREG